MKGVCRHHSPHGEKATDRTVRLCTPSSSATQTHAPPAALDGAHNRTVLSLLHVARQRPDGSQAAHHTLSVWPANVATCSISRGPARERSAGEGAALGADGDAFTSPSPPPPPRPRKENISTRYHARLWKCQESGNHFDLVYEEEERAAKFLEFQPSKNRRPDHTWRKADWPRWMTSSASDRNKPVSGQRGNGTLPYPSPPPLSDARLHYRRPRRCVSRARGARRSTPTPREAQRRQTQARQTAGNTKWRIS